MLNPIQWGGDSLHPWLQAVAPSGARYIIASLITFICCSLGYGQTPITITTENEVYIWSSSNNRAYVTNRVPSKTKLKVLGPDPENREFVQIVPTETCKSWVLATDITKSFSLEHPWRTYKTTMPVYVYYPIDPSVRSSDIRSLTQSSKKYFWNKTFLVDDAKPVTQFNQTYFKITPHPEEVRYVKTSDLPRMETISPTVPQITLPGQSNNNSLPPLTTLPSTNVPDPNFNANRPNNTYNTSPSIPNPIQNNDISGVLRSQPYGSTLPDTTYQPPTPNFDQYPVQVQQALTQAEMAYNQSNWEVAGQWYQNLSGSEYSSVRLLAMNRLEYIRQRPVLVQKQPEARMSSSAYQMPVGAGGSQVTELPMTRSYRAMPYPQQMQGNSNPAVPPLKMEPGQTLPNTTGPNIPLATEPGPAVREEIRPGQPMARTPEPTNTGGVGTFIPTSPVGGVAPRTGPTYQGSELRKVMGRLQKSQERDQGQPVYFLLDGTGKAICRVIVWTDTRIDLSRYASKRDPDIVELEGTWRENIPNQRLPQLNVRRVLQVNGNLQR